MRLNNLFLIIFLFSFSVFAAEVITDFSEESVPVLNNELREMKASINDLKKLTNLGIGSEVAVSVGVLTITESFHVVDTEADGATDDIDSITGGSIGDILVLRSAADGRDPTLKDSASLILSGDFTLSDTDDSIMLIKISDSAWMELSESDNG